MRELKNSLILMIKVNILYLSLFLFSSFVISQADDLTEELVVTGTLIKAKSQNQQELAIRILKI